MNSACVKRSPLQKGSTAFSTQSVVGESGSWHMPPDIMQSVAFAPITTPATATGKHSPAIGPRTALTVHVALQPNRRFQVALELRRQFRHRLPRIDQAIDFKI